ncbi:hypothetical protein ACJMK2_002127 [Sinanodonta woodiana]|uniref:Uncharacterized protein n=1 Tax=Sinanodonta woodiana TaxID=1069815 RepID=A0ABD3XUB7_SINWO
MDFHVITVCKTPIAMSGTITEAPEVELGQNYTYRCQDGLIGKRDVNPTVMCQAGGEWTTTNFTCVCKTPIAKSGTINETVEVELGQNYTYRCQEGLIGKRNLNPTVMCQPGGEWTTTNFICVCETPQKSGAITYTAEVEIGQNYTYRCEINLFKKGDGNPTVTCLHDGSWTPTNFICVTQNWTRDTVYPNNIHKSEVISNQTGNNFLACMQECDNQPNKCLSFFYDKQSGLCVLSSSFQRGLPNGLNFSDGVVYYTAPSISCDLQYRNVTLAGSYFCIKYHTELKSFEEAMKACESEKAKLLVVTTIDQITDLANIWPNLDWAVFIGLSDQIEEGRWVSWNGEIVKPVWAPGQPDNINNEDCGSMMWKREIHDIGCDRPFTFLCHKLHL